MKKLITLIISLLLLLPAFAFADPATESTQQGVKGELQEQTDLLEQIEENTAGGGVQSVVSVKFAWIVIGIPGGNVNTCPGTRQFVDLNSGTSYRAATTGNNNVPVISVVLPGAGSTTIIHSEFATVAERDQFLIDMFISMNQLVGTFAVALLDVNGNIDCSEWNALLLTQ